MRILITTDWYTPAVNGVVTSVLNLKRELERRGHDVLVLTMSMTHRTYQEDNVIYIASVNANRIYPNARVRLIFKGKWLQRILDWKPEIIHSQCEFNTFLTAKKISEILDIPIVHTYHTIYEDYTHYFSPSKRAGKTAVKAFTCMLCDSVQHVVVPTEKTAALLRSYGVKPKITVVPSGLEFTEPRRSGAVIREDLGIPSKQTVALYLGRLAKEKNLDEIISAFTQYKGEDITFLIVGDGPYRWELEEQTRTLPKNIHTRFVGMVTPEMVWDYYALADLYVSASQSETQGLTYIEAAASGLPLLCKYDECLTGLIEDGLNGWQFADKADFLKKFDLFMQASYIDRSVMAMFSRVAAERFDIHTTVPRILEVYEETMRSCKKAAAVM